MNTDNINPDDFKPIEEIPKPFIMKSLIVKMDNGDITSAVIYKDGVISLKDRILDDPRKVVAYLDKPVDYITGEPE